jgi:hypothetical protein
MDQNPLDFALETDASDHLDWDPSASPARPTQTLTNSPGCSPAPVLSLRPADRAPLRRVRTDAWSVPAAASWARPSRALRKVARRAIDSEMTEPA